MNWKTWVILAGALLGGLLLTAWGLSPRVLELTPSETDLYGRGPLIIRFNRAMDPDSVSTAFNLIPDLPGELSWNPENDELTFSPNENWPAGGSAVLEISAGARSRLRLPLLGGYQVELSVSPYLLTYLWPADGPSNLFLTNPETGEGQALTDLSSGILDYSLPLDGLSILISYPAAEGGSAIASLDRGSGEVEVLLDCQPNLCRSPQLSTDGSLLAYEFIPIPGGGLPGIRVLDLVAGTTINPGSDGEFLEGPSWSSQGWLAFYNQSQLAFEFWHPLRSENKLLPNDTPGVGTWSADGRYFISSRIEFISETLAPRSLQLFDLQEETLLDLSAGNFLEDLNPSAAPAGLSIAFSRKSLDPSAWSPGRQLWILDIETGQERQLSDELDYHHTSFAWHPDGDQLAYVRYNQASLSEPPEIWIINRDGTDALRLIIDGFAPGWIP